MSSIYCSISFVQALVLDCRNSYESDVGIFENARALNTTFFSESWYALNETLQGVAKDAPLMTYCTGEIYLLFSLVFLMLFYVVYLMFSCYFYSCSCTYIIVKVIIAILRLCCLVIHITGRRLEIIHSRKFHITASFLFLMICDLMLTFLWSYLRFLSPWQAGRKAIIVPIVDSHFCSEVYVI